MPKEAINGFVPKVEQVVFSDDSTWNCDAIWLPIPDAPSEDQTQDLNLNQNQLLDRKTSCSPQEYSTIWRCDCGTWNKEFICYNCGKKKSVLFLVNDESCFDIPSKASTDELDIMPSPNEGIVGTEEKVDNDEEIHAEGGNNGTVCPANEDDQESKASHKKELPFRVYNRWCVLAGILFAAYAVLIAIKTRDTSSTLYCPFALAIGHIYGKPYFDWFLSIYALCWFLVAVGLAFNYNSFSRVMSFFLFAMSVIIPASHFYPELATAYRYYASQVNNVYASSLSSYAWASIQIQDILIAVQLFIFARSFSLPAETAQKYIHVVMFLLIVSFAFRAICVPSWARVLAESAILLLGGYFCISRYYASNINIE